MHVSEDDFRELALSLPQTNEASHMGHPDFRVSGKIFATLRRAGPGSAMVKLNPAQQDAFIAAAPEVFEAVKGGWGRRGATAVHLSAAKEGVVRRALVAAWRNTAAKRLVRQFDDE